MESLNQGAAILRLAGEQKITPAAPGNFFADEREHFDEAGKAFMGVALLYDDPAITPRALQKAALAYQKAGKVEEADRVTKQLRDKYPDYAGGG